MIYGGRVNEESSSLFARKAQIAIARHGPSQPARRAGEFAQRAAKKRSKALARDNRTIGGDSRAARGGAQRTFCHGFEGDARSNASCTKPTARPTRSRGKKRRSINNSPPRLGGSRISKTKARTAALTSRRSGAACKRSQSAAETARSRDDELAEQLNELRSAVATERQRHEGLRTQRQPMTSASGRAGGVDRDPPGRRCAYQTRREQQALGDHHDRRSDRIGEHRIVRAESTVVEIARTRAARLAGGEHGPETDLRGRRKALSDLHDARGKEEVRQTQMQLKIENLSEHVMRRYQVDLGEFAPDRYAFTKTFRAQIKQRGKAEEELAEKRS